MKKFLDRLINELKDAFWLQIPYMIYSIVWLFLTMFWATTFFKWYVKNYL